jgi:gamma-glutamylcyclotransferase (GGCT)/AIG2-like uncharacterized protein YtfP
MNSVFKLFVYGTLRAGGPANHLLDGSTLVGNGIRLPGYKMFNAGTYPLVVPAALEYSILGDLYEVDEKTLVELDKFEGNQYRRRIDSVLKCVIYVSKELVSMHPEVEEGDWLSYARKHKIIFSPFD